jgi:hypothetical protein
MPLKSNLIAEVLRAANRVDHLSQEELRHELDVAVPLIERALESSEISDMPRMLEAQKYLHSVCASQQKLHAEDVKVALLYAADIIHMLRRSTHGQS